MHLSFPAPAPASCPSAARRKAQDGAELLYVPLGEELLRGVLEDLDQLG